MSQTPRTDALERTLETSDPYILIKWAEHARAIELELESVLARSPSWSEIGLLARVDSLIQKHDQLKAENENLRKLVGWTDGKLDVEELLNERDQLRAEVASYNNDILNLRAQNSLLTSSRDQWRAVAERAIKCCEYVRDYGTTSCGDQMEKSKLSYEQHNAGCMFHNTIATYEKLKGQS